MKYIPFHCSRRGALHVQYNLPKQDYAYSEETEDYLVVMTADGHGSRRHFRSERGAEFACKVAAKEIQNAFSRIDSFPFSEEQFKELKQNIITKWSKEIEDDINRNPFSEEEIEEQIKILTEEQLERLLDRKDDLIPYGTTLCAAFLCPSGWGAIQIGDGCLTTVNSDGEFDWPMPESMINAGNKTASLCLKDPMADFRHCFGADLPVAILVYTDGIEKSFRPESREIISFLHWILRNEKKQPDNLTSILESNLDTLSKRSRIGDDVSFAGVLDIDAADIVPKASKKQQYLELGRIQAAIKETESTITFTESRRDLLSIDETDELYDQLSDIIKRKTEMLDELKKREYSIIENLSALGEQLNLSVDNKTKNDDDKEREQESEQDTLEKQNNTDSTSDISPTDNEAHISDKKTDITDNRDHDFALSNEDDDDELFVKDEKKHEDTSELNPNRANDDNHEIEEELPTNEPYVPLETSCKDSFNQNHDTGEAQNHKTIILSKSHLECKVYDGDNGKPDYKNSLNPFDYI